MCIAGVQCASPCTQHHRTNVSACPRQCTVLRQHSWRVVRLSAPSARRQHGTPQSPTRCPRPFRQGMLAAAHGAVTHRRPSSRGTIDRLHVDRPPQPTFCPLPPCEPPLERRLRSAGSERGVAISMPKSMLTTTSCADMGRWKRKRDASSSSGAMG